MTDLDIAVIVPTRNRAKVLAQTLASLAAQRFPATRYEVLVVDNGSTDDTQSVVEGALRAFPGRRIRQICEPTPGLLAGRHRGVLETSAPLLSFVDDDIEADVGWLAAINSAFAEPDVQMVGGPNLPKYETEPPDWLHWFKHAGPGRSGQAWWCAHLSLLDFGAKRQVINPLFVFGLNFSIRRDILRRVNGFHPDGVPWEMRRFRGDGESAVSRGLTALGLNAVYEPSARVYHLVPASRLTIEYFERRSFLQGISDSYTEIRRRHGCEPSQPTGTDRGSTGLRNSWTRLKGRIKSLLGKAPGLTPTRPQDSMGVCSRTAQAYQEGYQYHQREVAKDPALLDWVTRADYWDCWLPLCEHFGSGAKRR